jgi:hypothetical protein
MRCGAKRLEQTSKLKTDPAFKSVLDSMEIKIMNAASTGNAQQAKTIGTWGTKAANEFAKLQSQKFNAFAKDWLTQNPGATAKDFQDWAKGLEPSYTNPAQFTVDPSTSLPAGMRSMAPELSTQKLVSRIPRSGGKFSEDYRHPKIQQALRTGGILSKDRQLLQRTLLSNQSIKPRKQYEQAEKTGYLPFLCY